MVAPTPSPSDYDKIQTKFKMVVHSDAQSNCP